MDKLEDRKKERRNKAMDALGISRSRGTREDAAQRARREAAKRVEGKRAEVREKHEKVIRDSVFNSQQSSGFDDTKASAPKKR
jgi:hypothetical protein